MNEKIMVVGLLAVVGLLYLFVGSATEGGQWFMEVDEAVASTAVSPDRPIRVKGNVVAGTYKTAEGSTEHRFSIAAAKGEAAMPVYYDGPMPDVFAEGREVVVEGFRRADGTLEATEVIAKCPSKYEGGLSPEAREALGDGAKHPEHIPKTGAGD
ncbi:MAG: cytochrome c maturation protein CcmE [bacterium]|nr:cytochrome c maturation protein CcmE [Myxococcales bacterium]MCB9542340.1 cytochrome c maturation protein CcmE [Myxococcales bacterium]MCB9552021.1 cytochrome c maturation protein CcmE [Myxococcales bacterium]